MPLPRSQGEGSQRLIAFLDDPAAGEAARMGGKGAGLRALVAAGFEVPDGFVIPVAVQRRSLAAAGLGPRLRAQAAGLARGDSADARFRAQELRALVRQVEIPANDRSALLGAYRRLETRHGSGIAVAVRSSAVLEDLPEASFSGQYDTLLGVSGPAALLDAVRVVWASVYNERAVTYRQRMGLGAEEPACAVVVQILAACEVAGVAFTSDPGTGARDRIRIEAVQGLCEGLVSGLVEPDHWTLDRESLEILERGTAPKRPRPVGLGDAEVAPNPVPGSEVTTPCLSDGQVRELARLSLEVETHLGAPADLEWGLVAGRLVLLQARPVTTALPLPSPEADWATERVLTQANLAETMPDPPTPLSWSLIRELWTRFFLPPSLANPLPRGLEVVRAIHGRPYADVTLVCRLPLGLEIIGQIDHVTARILRRMLAEGSAPRLHGLRLLRALRPIGALAWLLLGGPLVLAMLAATAMAPARIAGWLRRAGESLAARRGQAGDLEAPRERQVAELDSVFSEILAFTRRLLVPFVAGLASAGWLADLAAAAGIEAGKVRGQRLGAGDETSQTEQMGAGLHALASLARGDQALAAALTAGSPAEAWGRLQAEHPDSPFMAGLTAYLAGFGHRSPAEQEIEAPRFAEDPSLLVPMLRAQLRVEDPGRGPQSSRPIEAGARLALLAELDGRLRAQAWIPALPMLAWVMRGLLRIARPLFTFREDAKHYIFAAYFGYKRRVLTLGARLVRDGLITRPEDLLMLGHGELADWIARGCPDPERVRGTILRRRFDRERDRRRAAPMVLTSRGRSFFPESDEYEGPQGQSILQGQVASAGVVTGRVRVLRDPSEGDRLRPGEILVVAFTDPGWTPLFLVAGGLAMDVGGMLCHGATVAREVGIPAVVGLGAATTRLADGDLVVVDGHRGQVRILVPGSGGPSTPQR